MITEINEYTKLTKDILCEYKCRFDGRKYNSDNYGITINVSVRNVMHVKKIMVGLLLHVVVKMENI